jgi:CBS domain-containing protein
MLKLQDIMTTGVLTLGPQTTLRETVNLFAARHVSGAPVLDGERVVGVVSAHDILAFSASTSPVPVRREEPEDWAEWIESSDPPGWETEDEPAARFFTDGWDDDGPDTVERFTATATPEWDLLAEHTVSEVMTRRVLALPPTADVAAAADLMRRADVHRVLVMRGRALLGVVTTMDLVRAVADGRITRRTFVFDRKR